VSDLPVPGITGVAAPTSRWSNRVMTVSTVRSQEKKASARHPLAPLTVAEAGTAARVALDASGPGTQLVYVALDEPPKAAVLAWDGSPVPRRALCVVYERPRRLTWLVTVALDEPARVTSAVPAPGAQPLVTAEEFMADGEGIKQAPQFRAALARRGITDMANVQVDAWPASNFGLPVDESGRRLTRAVAYVLDGRNPNPYAKPFGFFDANPALNLAPSSGAGGAGGDHCHPPESISAGLFPPGYFRRAPLKGSALSVSRSVQMPRA
jgi:Cu2+-containing amine oxidase